MKTIKGSAYKSSVEGLVSTATIPHVGQFMEKHEATRSKLCLLLVEVEPSGVYLLKDYFVEILKSSLVDLF